MEHAPSRSPVIDRPHAFDSGAIEHGISYVAQASKGLRLAVRLAQHSDAAANLKAAPGSRTHVS